MFVMSYAFPLFICAHFFQVVLPETYQECLALVARSGGVDRVEIARQLHFPPHLLESPDLRRFLRNAYRKLVQCWILGLDSPGLDYRYTLDYADYRYTLDLFFVLLLL